MSYIPHRTSQVDWENAASNIADFSTDGPRVIAGDTNRYGTKCDKMAGSRWRDVEATQSMKMHGSASPGGRRLYELFSYLQAATPAGQGLEHKDGLGEALRPGSPRLHLHQGNLARDLHFHSDLDETCMPPMDLDSWHTGVEWEPSEVGRAATRRLGHIK